MPYNRDELPEDVSFFLNLDEPSEECMKIARQTLGETPDVRACALQELSDMIYEKGEVVPLRMDDEYLLRFLRARHFQVEKTHKLMVNYYNFRDNNVTLHEEISVWDEKPQLIAREDIISVLPYVDQHGRRSMIFKLGNWNPSECCIDELFKTTLMLLELAILEPRAQIVGGVCFFDMENLSLQQAWQVTPSVANKVIQLMGTSFPIRVQEIHILNQPWVFETVFAMFKPFLNARMSSKIHFHGSNFETLHTFIEPKYLPEIYGGTRPYYQHTNWFDEFPNCPYILKELTSIGYVRCNVKDSRAALTLRDEEEKKIANQEETSSAN